MAATRQLRIITASLVILVLIVSAIFMDAQSIDVIEQQLTIYGLHEDLQGLRILHLSDMNSQDFGEEQAQLIRKLNSLDYDIVVLTGDMVGGRDDASQLYELLDALPSSKEVYIISGDAHPGPFVSVARDINGTLNQIVLQEWILYAMDRGAIYVDRPVSQKIGDATITISVSKV
jgi:predicted MPP superfamily phosphohydrolase